MLQLCWLVGMPFDIRNLRAEEAKQTAILSLEPLGIPDKHMSDEDFCADVDAMMLDAPTGTC